MPSSVTGRYRDDSSVQMFGHAPRTISTVLASSDACFQMARALVQRWAQPQTRVQPFTVRPKTEAQLATVCGLEIGDLVTVQLNPPGGGAQIALTIVVDSIAHRMSQDQVWDITLSGSPADPNTYFTLDVSELDGTDVLGY